MPSIPQLVRRVSEQAGALSLAMAEAKAWGGRYRETVEAEQRLRVQSIEEERKRALGNARENHARVLADVRARLDKVAEAAGLGVAPWDDPAWTAFVPREAPPAVVRLGELTVRGPSTTLTSPAMAEFVGGRNTVIKARGEHKTRAILAVQAFVLRLLALVPPSKLRLLLIDPVGLGQNLAVFMNLQEHMPDLVTGKVWVERADIERRLADLSAHMEMVIQTYLRGHFRTMEDYNASAGEVAEPYRLVVAVNFPANFSEEAAQRLLSIATNGPQCGVFSVVVVDTGMATPRGFDLAALEREAMVVEAKNGGFIWDDPDFGRDSLDLDLPPPQPLYENLVNGVGAAAKEASRVELPYAKIAPEPAAWWKGDASSGLTSPIGRAGARKTQMFSVGKGAEQHVLVAGRTGTGKSTLLHVLILGLAMTYPPDELEFYLVDFKKGVEFKDYATHGLPQAKVVAIESEREFGISVLQALDAELTKRGEAFREAGCSVLSDYRGLAEASPARVKYGKLPRILLVVDEFQEFFTVDDSLARQAGLLLDRLARQGRAFGIHIVLGSQTLAGTYTLTRSTMDQMSVRIALGCSDADSRLILAEDNPAARLLSRPGDAFYNPMGGLREGNTRFQVAWVRDAEKEAYLAQIRQLSHDRRRPIVFEGNAPANVDEREDHPLDRLLDLPGWPPPQKVTQVWLGEPVSIKGPTAATFARRRGRNLVVAGRDEDAALGMIISALASLRAQHRPEDAEIVVADLSLEASEGESVLQRFCACLPSSVRFVLARRLAEAVAQVAETVSARTRDDGPGGPMLYLVIFGLQRARDLRRNDDVAWRGRDGGASTPSEQLARILTDGPEVGVHFLGWSDTPAAFNQVVDRKTVGEVGLRVALSLSERESQDFLDSPAASKLGPHRALLFDDERIGVLEKFRPYGPPTPQWMDRVRRTLGSREGKATEKGEVRPT